MLSFAKLSLNLNFNWGWYSVILILIQQPNQPPTLKAGQTPDYFKTVSELPNGNFKSAVRLFKDSFKIIEDYFKSI